MKAILITMYLIGSFTLCYIAGTIGAERMHQIKAQHTTQYIEHK